MKSLIPILVSIIVVNTAVSQTNSEIGIIVSPQATFLKPNPNDVHLTVKFNSGIIIGRYFFQKIKISSGIVFSEQGANISNPKIFAGTLKLSLSYIKIPLVVTYDICKTESINFGLLAECGYNVKVNSSNHLYPSTGFPNDLIIPDVNSYDISGSLGVKLDYKIADKTYLYSALSYSRGFRKVYKEFIWTIFNLENSHNELISLAVGITYRF